MRNRVRVDVSSNQVRNVRYINEQVSIDVVSDFTYFRLVYYVGICREIIDNYFRFVFFGLFFQIGVVDMIGSIDIVRNDVVQFIGEVNRRIVSQVIVMRQVYIQNGIIWFQQRGVDRKVSLGVGVRLDVSVVSVEQFFRTIDRQLFNDINIFVIVVVAFVRIIFSIFVGQLRILRLYYARVGVVFGGDQFDVFFLTYFFLFYSLLQFGIIIGNVYFTF